MPHDMIVFHPGTQLPAHIAANPPPISLNANAQQGIRIPFPVVSINGKKWTVIYRGVETVITASPGFDANQNPLPAAPVSALKVVIVGISPAKSRVWYAKGYQPGVKGVIPDCFSNDGEIPDSQSTNIQSPRCDICPKSKFESAINRDGTQGKGQACREGRKIAVVPANDVKNNFFGGPMMIRLPVMSIPNLARYAGELNMVDPPVDISQVVTSMTFNMSVSVEYPEVQFSAIGYVETLEDTQTVNSWMRSDIVRQMLDEAPTFENTGVSPVQPRREDFHIPSESRSAFMIEADNLLNTTPDPGDWTDHLQHFAETAASIGELTELFALSCVKQAREMAPLSVRNRIQKMLDDAVERLAPRDEPPPSDGEMAPSPVSQPWTQASTSPAAELDSAGVAWDEKLHASTKAKKADGTWRARRGAEPQQASAPAAGQPTWDADHSAQEPARAEPPAGLETTAAPPASSADFRQWLVDAEGEVMRDETGDYPDKPHDNPIEFIKAYLNALDAEFPGHRDRFVAANQGAVIAARIASPQVSRMLADHVRAAAPAGDSPTLPMDLPRDPAAVPAPAKPSPAELDRYHQALGVVLSGATTMASVDHIREVNLAAITALPKVRYLKAMGLFEARQKDLTPPLAKGETISHEATAKELLSDIAGLMSLDQAGAWLAMNSVGRAFDRLKFDAPVLCDEVMETFAAKRRSFAPSERTPTEIAENMKAGLRGCQTKQDIITWRSQANIVKDEAFLTKEHPGIWADVLALGKKLSAELPGTVS